MKLKLQETVRLSLVLQQLHNSRFMWLCVTYVLKQGHSSMKPQLSAYITDFMQLVSFVTA
jgi:hypothetical protein